MNRQGLETLSGEAIAAIRRAAVVGTSRQPERAAVRTARRLWRYATRLQEGARIRQNMQAQTPRPARALPPRPRRPFTVGFPEE